MLKNALSVLPERLKAVISGACAGVRRVYEIHLLSARSVYLSTPDGLRFVTESGLLLSDPSGKKLLLPEKKELEETAERAAGYSGFVHEGELKNGFISFAGGCRMGLCTSGGAGSGGFGEITSLCIRVPAGEEESFFSPDTVRRLFPFSQGLLIAGPPASGKTTLLRHLAKGISAGESGAYRKVCVIDERTEISGGGFSLGPACDVLAGKKKEIAIQQALRVLSPDIIVCDEIGSENESRAILEGLNSGVLFAATIHAADIRQLVRRKQFRLLFDENVFDRFVFLSGLTPGKISAVYGYEEVRDEINRACGAVYGVRVERDIHSVAP